MIIFEIIVAVFSLEIILSLPFVAFKFIFIVIEFCFVIKFILYFVGVLLVQIAIEIIEIVLFGLRKHSLKLCVAII